jgi:imidazolonepropionase-like amidohydrolase
MKYLPALAATAVVALAQAPSAPSTLAIRNAKVVSVSGAVMDRGTVVIRDGLIDDVGVNASIPAGAWIVEGDGLTVYPGLIDSLSSWSLFIQD